MNDVDNPLSADFDDRDFPSDYFPAVERQQGPHAPFEIHGEIFHGVL
jgi:hypothetical protein